MAVKKLSWKTFNEQCISLANKVIKDYQPDFIYGVPRGGLIPATIISHHLDIPMIMTLEGNCNKILIIDEIVDSSATLIKIIDKYPHVKFASLYVNTDNCKQYPHYYLKKTVEWIVFPYEKQLDTVSKVLKKL